MMRFRFGLALLAGALAACLSLGAVADDFDTKAKFAVLMDYDTGSILYDKAGDERLEPASMAKLMTLAVVFTYLQQKKLSLDDQFVISQHAWKDGGASSGGSTMFAVLNSKIRVEDLIKSVVIQSGNDAAIALAEGIGGDEPTFAKIENKLAQQIGLTGSNFTNATGLPDPDQYSTAHDLATLSRYIIMNFPEFYPLFSVTEFTWNKIRQMNRNSLLELGLGVDGLKTGHTQESGYGEIVSAPNGGRRLIAVLHGLSTMAERAEEARKLLTWGMHGFELMPMFPEGKVIARADVFGGTTSSVGLVGKGKIDLLLPKAADNCPTATVTYKGPLRPPVTEGEQVAQLNVFCGGKLVQQAPLYAAATVEQGDLLRRAMDSAKHLLLGWIP